MWNYIKLVIGTLGIIYSVYLFVLFVPFGDGEFFTSKDDLALIGLLAGVLAIGGYLSYTSFKKLTNKNDKG